MIIFTLLYLPVIYLFQQFYSNIFLTGCVQNFHTAVQLQCRCMACTLELTTILILWKLVGNFPQIRTVDLSELGWHWPVSSKPKITEMKKPLKHYTEKVARTSAVFAKKEETFPNSQRHHKDPSLARDAQRHLTWRQRWQDEEMDGKWATDQQSLWTACCQNDLTADHPYQSTHTPLHHPH